MLRLTWVQPEDLIGHELRQAAQDGREPSRPSRPAGEQRAAARPRCRGRVPAPGVPLPSPPGRRPPGRTGRSAREPFGTTTNRRSSRPARAASRGLSCPELAGAGGHRRATGAAAPPTGCEAAWLGRATGCLLGKPVEKLPLEAIRQLAQSTGNWPLTTYFTARGVPADLLRPHPWNRRSANNSLAENIDGMPEDDDLNYPLLNLLLLQRHGRAFTTTDVARTLARRAPRRPHLHRRTHRLPQPPHRPGAPAHRPPPQPVPRMDRRPDPRRRPRLDQPRRPGRRRRTGPPGRHPHPHRQRRLRGDVHGGRHRYAQRPATHDVHTCLSTGLTVVPPDSRLARAVRHAIRLARNTADFDTVVDALHAAHAGPTTGCTPSPTPP